MTFHSSFDKSLLPDARQVYVTELGKLWREDRHGWCAANCPFHESKSKRSFAVNLRSGGFLCRAPHCGVKGGDVLDFVKLRYRLDFKGAKNYLRVFDDSTALPAVETVPAAWLHCDFTVDGINYRAAVKDEPENDPANYRQKIRRFYHDARELLDELGPGESEAHEQCWARLACGFDELRELGAVR